MRPKLIAFVLSAMLAATSCGSGSAAGSTSREVTRALGALRAEARSYRYTDQTLDGSQRIVIDGRVQDDLRYSGTVSLNGKKLYQEIVSDDSVAIRILDLERMKPVLDRVERADPITARALREKRWVIDHTVAPPLLAAAAIAEDDEERTADRPQAARPGQNLVGDDPFADAAQAINYTERAVRNGFRVERFNPEDIEYNALDDPWRDDANVDLENQGVRRYDLQVPPLPARANRGDRQSLPQIEHFRKMAIYVRGRHAVRVLEQISITDRREFRRAEAGRSAKFYLDMRDGALQGGVEDELRERRMELEVTRLGDTRVEVPLDAEQGLLRDVLPAIKTLFQFEFVGGPAAIRPDVPR